MAGAFVFNDFNRFMDLQIMAIQGKEIARMKICYVK